MQFWNEHLKYVYSILVIFHFCLCVDLLTPELCSILLLQHRPFGSKPVVGNVLGTGTKSREKKIVEGPHYK